mgnify:CR=1 FL=1
MDLKYHKTDYLLFEAILGKLLPLVSDAEMEVGGWKRRYSRYIKPGEYEYLEEWKDISPGEKWTVNPEITAFFSTVVNIPDKLKGRDLYLNLKIGGEALLYLNGRPYHGLDRNRNMVKLEDDLKSAGTVDILIEAAVDRQSYEFQYRYWANAKYKDHRFETAKIVAVNKSVWDYYFDLATAKEFYKNLPDGEMKNRYYLGLKDSVMAIDFVSGREGVINSLPKAKSILYNEIGEIHNKLSDSTIHLIGHSHLDIGYLWPVKETIRKSARTFSTALRLMDQYGYYKFTQSQPQLYEYAKTYFPEIYEGIKERVKMGQLEAEGAMWVEPDCNLISGESFIRQILVGKEFFKNEFGKDSRILWLPDTFGFSYILPQIMKGCGIDYFVTQKIQWNRINKFPYDLFRWKSADGSEVLALFTGDYNGAVSGSDIRKKYETFDGDGNRSDYPLLYGFGDGGGGVTLEMLETIKRLNRLNKTANFKTSFASELLNKLSGSCEHLPVWDDELYLEAHRGVYTTHAELKKLNRLCERTLRDTEFFLSISSMEHGSYYTKLKEIWKKVLTNQFHDILSGSTIAETFYNAVDSYNEVLFEAKKLKESASESIFEDCKHQDMETFIMVWNTLGWERNDVAEIKLDNIYKNNRYNVFDENGSKIPCQITEKNGSKLAFPVELPSMGYKVYKIVTEKEDMPSADIFRSGCIKQSNKVSNKYFRIEFNKEGNITSIFDKRNGREIVPSSKEANVFQIFVDEPQQYDAWEIDEFSSNKWYENFEVQDMRILEDGPVIKRIRITKKWNKSLINQDIVLYDNMPRIDFETEVDWQEDRKLLKVAFPVDIVTREATYDIAYGTIKRATHDNTGWEQAKFEVPAHMWADLSEYGYGVSLLNDSKYGYDIKGNVMRLSLLKSPINPNPKADRGRHRFVYSILSHLGSWQEGGTAKQGYQLNTPLSILKDKKVKSGADFGNILSVDCDNVFIEAVKPAEDGNGIIVRLLEKYGKNCCVKVQTGLPVKSVMKCNMIEEAEFEIPCNRRSFTYNIRPYKIETFRLLL